MWCNSDNLNKVTGVAYGTARYPFPLDRILNYYESQRVRQAADASCQSWASVWCSHACSEWSIHVITAS